MCEGVSEGVSSVIVGIVMVWYDVCDKLNIFKVKGDKCGRGSVSSSVIG